MVYVTGDMHGDIDRFFDSQIKKLKEKDTLIIAGDFGFVWDGSKQERKFLKYLGKRKFNICFVDGPHDNYDRIYACRETYWKGGRVHRISGNLFHLCRGQVFEMEGYRIFTFGGGESLDKDIRAENNVWFRAELPSISQMEEGERSIEEAEGKIDYIITHEPPSVLKSALQMRAGNADNVSILNGYLEEIGRSCEYKRWFFGSVHFDRVITPKHIAVFKNIIPIDESVIV